MLEVEVAEPDQAQNYLLQDDSTDTQNLCFSVAHYCFFSLYVQSWTRKERRTKVVWAVKVSSTETDEVGKQCNVILRTKGGKHKCDTLPFLLLTVFSVIFGLMKHKGNVAKSYQQCTEKTQ